MLTLQGGIACTPHSCTCSIHSRNPTIMNHNIQVKTFNAQIMDWDVRSNRTFITRRRPHAGGFLEAMPGISRYRTDYVGPIGYHYFSSCRCPVGDGKVAELVNAVVLKTAVIKVVREFESHPFPEIIV